MLALKPQTIGGNYTGNALVLDDEYHCPLLILCYKKAMTS